MYYSVRGGMFWLDMRLRRTVRAAFVWLSLLLPLQSYAAVPCGQPEQTNLSAEIGFAAHHHCAKGSTLLHHHSCGNCCCSAAIALTCLQGIAPSRRPLKFTTPLVGGRPSVRSSASIVLLASFPPDAAQRRRCAGPRLAASTVYCGVLGEPS